MAEFVGNFMLLERPRSLRNDTFVLGISEVRLDDRHHSRFGNEPRVLDAVKAGVKRQRNSHKRPAKLQSRVSEFFE